MTGCICANLTTGWVKEQLARKLLKNQRVFMEKLLLLLLVIGFWFWYEGLRARETAVAAVRRACESEGLQLLDETVAITSVKPVRNDRGMLVLRRVYGFEYSDTGDNRRKGSVTMLGQKLALLSIGPTLRCF
jgi:hypothetical protein